MTDVRALLEATFPIQSDFFSLEWVPDSEYRPASAAEDDFYAVVRLICWDFDGPELRIRDVKEQAVLLVPAHSRHDERLEAWFQGWREALLAVMKSQARAPEDFTRALLDSKRRLGGLLFPPPKP